MRAKNYKGKLTSARNLKEKQLQSAKGSTDNKMRQSTVAVSFYEKQHHQLSISLHKTVTKCCRQNVKNI